MALDPNYIISSKVNAENKFKELVEILYGRDWITSIMADNAKKQFFNLTSCTKAKFNEKFEKFTENDSRLDDFIMVLLVKTNLVKIFGLSSKLLFTWPSLR